MLGIQFAKVSVLDDQFGDKHIVVKPKKELYFKGSNIGKFIEYKPDKFIVALNSTDLYHWDVKSEGILPIKKNLERAPELRVPCHEFFLLDFTTNYIVYKDDCRIYLIDVSEDLKNVKCMNMFVIYQSVDIQYRPFLEFAPKQML